MFEKLKDCVVIVIMLLGLSTLVGETYLAAHLLAAVRNTINGAPAESIPLIVVCMISGIGFVALLRWLVDQIYYGEILGDDSRLGRWFEHRSEAKERKRQQEMEESDPMYRLAMQAKRIHCAQREVEENLNNIKKKVTSIHGEITEARFLEKDLDKKIKIAVSNQQDDVARDLIREKQKQQDRLAQLEASLSFARENQEKVQRMYDALAKNDISLGDKQRDVDILKEVAHAQKVVTDLYQSMGIQSHYKN